MRTILMLGVTIALASLHNAASAETKSILEQALKEKIHGFWIGQMAGNYVGFPFESIYVDEPIPFLVDRLYTFRDDESIELHRYDLRGFVPIVADYVEGAFSDDDTDIEFMTLHAVERYGLDIDYAEITEAWKRHVNRRIWVANRSARNLMDQGFVAPDTGRRENNPNWFQIDPQLVNEIWSAFYPGMIDKAVERAEWGARITNDSWGTHPTRAYAAMISAAFFETDVDRLVQIGLETVPKDSPFRAGMKDVIAWHKKNDDWRVTRKLMHDKYYAYKSGGEEYPVSVVSALINGLAGVLAILYGEGDFLKTVGIATSAGYDCDNQAATCGGLIGVLHGASAVPDSLTKEIRYGHPWREPFNNQYVNVSRDDLPIVTKISDLVDRTAAIAQQAILENGGQKIMLEGEPAYLIETVP